MQIEHLSVQLASQTSRGLNGNTLDNPNNESCNVIKLRDIIVSLVTYPRSERKIEWRK